jgi:hypothetical protein
MILRLSLLAVTASASLWCAYRAWAAGRRLRSLDREWADRERRGTASRSVWFMQP